MRHQVSFTFQMSSPINAHHEQTQNIRNIEEQKVTIFIFSNCESAKNVSGPHSFVRIMKLVEVTSTFIQFKDNKRRARHMLHIIIQKIQKSEKFSLGTMFDNIWKKGIYSEHAVNKCAENEQNQFVTDFPFLNKRITPYSSTLLRYV